MGYKNNDSFISSPQGYPGFHVYFVDNHTIVRPGEQTRNGPPRIVQKRTSFIAALESSNLQGLLLYNVEYH